MIKDNYAFSRKMYIIEAALEYFVSILVAGAYLASLTQAVGISDRVTGILSSLVSLGYGFQLFAIFLSHKKSVKNTVAILHTVNQLFFSIIYFIPFFSISKEIKTVLLIVFLLGGHIINNVVQSPKINWYMSMVDNDKRGRFTANKEIISLISGMIFSFAMSAIIDGYTERGETETAFVLIGITLLVLTALHTCTLLFSTEKESGKEPMPIKKMLGECIRDKRLMKTVLVAVIWHIAHYATIPFYGTYTIKELGFTMTFVSLLSAAYAIIRSLVSRPMGKLADKTSFSKMLTVCFAVELVALLINTFTAPSNGMILYTLYQALYAIAMAGINSGEINLVYECVSEEKRVFALAFKNTIAGFAGFLSTLVFGYLVEYIQKNGNKFLGMNVYAQQVLSAIGAIIVAVLIIYLRIIDRKERD